MPRRQRHTKKRGGGSNAPSPSSYSSASTYGQMVNGDVNSQFDRTFQGSGPATYVGVQGQRAGSRRRRRSSRSRSRSRKSHSGGFFGSIINQAIVPFSLLGMQQTAFKKRRMTGGRRRSRK